MVDVSLVHIPRWHDGVDVMTAIMQVWVLEHQSPIKMIEFHRKILRVGNQPSPVIALGAQRIIVSPNLFDFVKYERLWSGRWWCRHLRHWWRWRRRRWWWRRFPWERCLPIRRWPRWWVRLAIRNYSALRRC